TEPDGLVAIRQTSDANVLVPDLAEAIPVPTDGRRTYTFTVRRWIRYSTGEVVRAADFELGLRRALVGYGRPDFFYGIVGARACGPTKPHCDLSAGIVTDEATRRVTIHLTDPDPYPEFLYKLAWFVYPEPPGTPLTAARAPLPGTGPYRI